MNYKLKLQEKFIYHLVGKAQLQCSTLIINNSQRGQTLVLLLVFMAIAITVLSASIVITGINSTASSKTELGNNALDVATSGGENALMRLLRDPSYLGETLTVGNGTATVTVSSGTITSIGVYKNFSRTVQIVTSYNGNVLTISSWKEVF